MLNERRFLWSLQWWASVVLPVADYHQLIHTFIGDAHLYVEELALIKAAAKVYPAPTQGDQPLTCC